MGVGREGEVGEGGAENCLRMAFLDEGENYRLRRDFAVPAAVKSKYDSLFAERIGLSMMIVRKQMKIDSLKK